MNGQLIKACERVIFSLLHPSPVHGKCIQAKGYRQRASRFRQRNCFSITEISGDRFWEQFFGPLAEKLCLALQLVGFGSSLGSIGERISVSDGQGEAQ